MTGCSRLGKAALLAAYDGRRDDYIACDKAHAGMFKVANAHVVEDRMSSDHAPIVVTVETPEKAASRPALVPAPVRMKVREGICRAKAGTVTETVFTKRETDASI